ncbi:MAG TPA: hypothetical protein VJB67_03090 [Patescibacteria group bacterium]|nr:hypothetical protein [Patescibacteria group bacterium]
MSFQILKFSSLMLLILLVIVSGILFYHFQTTTAAELGDDELAGWIWTENYGWISLNADNCLLLNKQNEPDFCTTSGVDYKVIADPTGKISGYGWSENVGWVCFGVTCGGGLSASYDLSSGKITGWAKVVSLGDDGQLKLGRGWSTITSSMGVACYDCERKCVSWTRQCSGDPEVCIDIAPCLQYDPTEYENCATCFTKTCFGADLGSGEIDPASNCDPDHQHPLDIPDDDPVAGGSGVFCTGVRDSFEPNGSCANCWSNCERTPTTGDNYIIQCGTRPNSCEIYGANVDLSTSGLIGWGWNGAKDSGSNLVIGAGWVHFSSANSYIQKPWLETQYGVIFTPNDVRQKTRVQGNNATYCIFATDILNVTSSDCDQQFISDININFPSSNASQIYRNALGKINYSGLITDIGGGRNQYGNEIEAINNLNQINGKVLDGKVYFRNGDLTVDSDFDFVNASTAKKGNGLIVINGNLMINKNIGYNGGSLPDSLDQLASVGWIIKGDVIIDPSVKNIVGAFVVLGKDGAICQYEDDESCNDTRDYPKYNKTGYGIIFTSESDLSFTALGLMVAKAFDFRRTYSDIVQGSERIIYDGRLIANPPPGMEGFSEGLPVIRDFTY